MGQVRRDNQGDLLCFIDSYRARRVVSVERDKGV